MSADRARVEAFFERGLPAALSQHKDLARATKGSVAIIVEGAGSWTLTFPGRGQDPTLLDDADPDADLLCVWMLPAFCKLLDGERDIAAIRPVALVGDERLLERLGALLVPPQKGGLNARLASLKAA